MLGKRLRLGLILIGLILVAPLGWLGWEHVRGRSQLRTEVRELEARGESMDPARISPPSPAGTEAFDLASGSSERLGAVARSKPPAIVSPSPGEGIPSSHLPAWDASGGARMTWAILAERLEQSGADLEGLQAALESPDCRIVADLSQGFRSPLKPLASLLTGAEALSALTAHFAAEEDFDRALRAYRALWRFDALLADVPTTIGQLMRMSFSSIASARGWDVVNARPWTEEQLARLQAAVPDARISPGMVRAIEGERAMFWVEARRTAEDTEDLVHSLGRFSGVPLAGGALALEGQGRLGLLLFRFGWHDQAVAAHLHALGELRATGMQAVTANSAALLAGADLNTLVERAGGNSLRGVYARGLLPSLSTSFRQAFIADARRSLLTAGIALERYHRRHSRYPEALHELVPEFLPLVPIDCMDGQPLRYQAKPGGGFSLWSVGENQRDDGGDASPTSPERRWEEKDLVWLRLASAEAIRAWVQAEEVKRERREREKADVRPTMSPELLQRYTPSP